MSRKRVHRLPRNLSFDGESGRYRYRNPLTGERFWIGKSRMQAIAKANLYNKEVDALSAQQHARAAAPTVEEVVDLYISDVVPMKPWDDGTKKNHLFALAMYQREFAGTLLPTLDRTRIGSWLAQRASSGESYNKHRARWIDLYRYAISRGIVDYNEAEATLKMSVSKKIARNRKRRGRMTVAQFWTVHGSADHWLQVAMETSLVTLQSRAEVCRMQKSDQRDGWLYVIRDKTAGDSDMAFIRIRVTPQISEIWRRAWSDGIACPYLVHRIPESKRPQHLDCKPHPFAVEPGYLTRQFRRIRDESGAFDHIETKERPTFHEIRSLGARLYRRLGWSHDQIRALMTHTHTRTTDIYLTNPGQIADDDYHPVEATLDLKSLPRI